MPPPLPRLQDLLLQDLLLLVLRPLLAVRCLRRRERSTTRSGQRRQRERLSQGRLSRANSIMQKIEETSELPNVLGRLSRPCGSMTTVQSGAPRQNRHRRKPLRRIRGSILGGSPRRDRRPLRLVLVRWPPPSTRLLRDCLLLDQDLFLDQDLLLLILLLLLLLLLARAWPRAGASKRRGPRRAGPRLSGTRASASR